MRHQGVACCAEWRVPPDAPIVKSIPPGGPCLYILCRMICAAPQSTPEATTPMPFSEQMGPHRSGRCERPDCATDPS